jgi:hypothetical protein
MPVYSLRCEGCGKTVDVMESFGLHEEHMNKHDLPCPNCGSTRLEPQLGILAREDIQEELRGPTSTRALGLGPRPRKNRSCRRRVFVEAP